MKHMLPLARLRKFFGCIFQREPSRKFAKSGLAFSLAFLAFNPNAYSSALPETNSHIAIDLYDLNKREVEGDRYYSSPYGSQKQYYLDPSPEAGQYYREPTGNRSGYYTVPRGQSTYQQGHYEKGRFYVEPNTPYPGDKPHQEYQPRL